MRIAVYTIAKNEARFVERWARSAEEADYLFIVDTGSTDDTVPQARALDVNVAEVMIAPWRFDDARNVSLALLPADIDMCIALDMDEILRPGWREALETMPSGTTRPRYKYVWSWNDDGTEGLVYGGDKIHRRHGYRWKHPVHEVLTPTIDEQQAWINLEIHHHPDSTKSRAQYFPLLEVARNEAMHDDRTAFYYARELFYHGRHEEAATEFQRHLAMPTATWRPERAASMRFIAKCGIDPERWYTLATLESPDRREPWVDLAFWSYCHQDWQQVIRCCTRALAITVPPLEYLCEPEAWGARPHDLLAIAYWNVGRHAEALAQARQASMLEPSDERLAGNVNMMSGVITGEHDQQASNLDV